MIHGFRGTHHGLIPIAKHIKGLRVVIPDLPGFGKGATLKDYSLESYVKWLRDYIRQQKLSQPPILLGHSFGSIISAAYAEEYPETIQKLVLVNPIGAPALEGPRGLLTKLTVFYYWAGTKLSPKLGQKWLSSQLVTDAMSKIMTKTDDEAMREFIKTQHRQHFGRFHTPRSVSEGFQTSVTYSVRDFANNITTPTLLIAGSLDDITPLSKQYQLVKLFPKAKLRVINNVGHLTHYETAEKVAQLTQAFCKLS